jgi:transcription elongation factor Elf1
VRNGVIGDYNINLSPKVFSMLVECPDCDEQLEIESGEGTLFECPSCGLDFEVDLTESNDFLHSENYWGLVLDSQVCYAEN